MIEIKVGDHRASCEFGGTWIHEASAPLLIKALKRRRYAGRVRLLTGGGSFVEWMTPENALVGLAAKAAREIPYVHRGERG